ncbi:MAG: hypothetical protein HY822_13565 [Acidobacteria bacterium]|nr:hypothetical protein [Acidobacteriota bacterium]
MRFPERLGRPTFWALAPVLLILLLSAYGAERSALTLSADRSEYRPGETVELTINTKAGGPYDIYMRVTGPKGVLWADQGLQFQRRMVAAAENFVLADGAVKVPVSISRKELVQPGAYTFEAIVVPPGASPLTQASFPTERSTIYVPALPGINFLAMHNPDSARYRGDCGTCHLDKIRNTSLAPNIKSFHAMKVELFLGNEHPELACRVCHKGADLIEFSQAALRKQSSPDTCALCHTRSGPGKRLYAR